MSTALTLINRLRAKAREEQVSAFAAGDNLHVALISELNQAVRIVLEERTWNFQSRSDGVLVTRKSHEDFSGTGTGTVLSSGPVTLVDAASADNTDLSGDFTTSILFRANISNFYIYDDTSFDLVACRTTGDAINGTVANFPVGLYNVAGFRIFIYQYALPITVKSITEIWHQEENIELFHEDEHNFRQLIPRPHEDFGSMPRVAFIGGTITTTVSNASTSTGVVRDSIKLWPVSGTPESINYRYVYRQPDLVNPTDEIKGVPLGVEDLIIQLAYARQLQSIQSDVTRGSTMEALVMDEINRKHRNNRFDPRRSRTLKSLDDLERSPSALTRTHSTVPGWP